MFTSTSAANILALALVTVIGLPSSLTTTTTTSSTMPVKNEYECLEGRAYLLCGYSASPGHDPNGTECRWWQNDKELSRSDKYQINRVEDYSRWCSLKIIKVEKLDAQPTYYRCSDGDKVDRVTIHMWPKVDPPNLPALTVGGQAVAADGGMLNLTALSYLHPPPVIQCSIGPMRPAPDLRFQFEKYGEILNSENDWLQSEISKKPGHLFFTTIRMLANDTRLVAGQNLSCAIDHWQLCDEYMQYREHSKILTIIGKYEWSRTELRAVPAVPTAKVPLAYTVSAVVATDKVPLVATGCAAVPTDTVPLTIAWVVVVLLVIVAFAAIGVVIVERRKRSASNCSVPPVSQWWSQITSTRPPSQAPHSQLTQMATC